MKLRPLGNNLVIKKVEAEEKTASGILLPDSAKEDSQIAEILAIGADIKEEVKVGDKVIFSKFAGSEVKVDGEEVTILKITDILAVVE